MPRGYWLQLLQLLVVALFLAPVVLLLLGSLHPPGSVPVPGHLWPDKLSLQAWLAVFQQVPMATALQNSIVVMLLFVPLAVASASLAGFALNLLGARARFCLLLMLIVAASLPYSAIWLPRFLLVQNLGFSGTWLPLWLPALLGGSPLLVLLYFVAVRSLPFTPVQAARLEGLGWWSIWWKVILPQLPGVNLVVAALAGIWCWANYLDPLLYLHREAQQTAPLMLNSLELVGPSNWPLLMAGALIVSLPLLLMGLMAIIISLVRAGLQRGVSAAVLLLVLLGSGGLVACGQPSTSSTKPVQLRLQAVADPAEAKAYRSLIKAFEAQQSDIQVEFIPVGRHAEHVTRMVTALAARQAPDLFLINFRRWGQFIAHDVLQPMGPLLEQLDGFDRGDFYALSLEGFTHNDKLMCMPQNISSLVVYWNRSLFKRYGVPPPQTDWTWKDFHDAAIALTHDSDGDGEKDIFGLTVDPSIVRLAPFVWQAGGAVVNDVQRPRHFRLRDRDSVIGLMFLKRLRSERGVMPSLAQRRAQAPDARFLRGGAGMTLNSRRYTANLRANAQLDWDVAPLPRHKQAATVLHADAYCLFKSSPYPQAAARFVRFATSQRGQEIMSESGRIVPVRRSVAQSSAFLDPQQAPASAQVFLDAIGHMRRTPNIANWYEIETRINPIIEEWMFETPPPGLVEEMTGLKDGYRLALTIERTAGALLQEPPR